MGCEQGSETSQPPEKVITTNGESSQPPNIEDKNHAIQPQLSTEKSTDPLEADLAEIHGLVLAGRFIDAELKARPLAKQYPTSGRASFYLAVSLHKQKHYQAAAPLFAKALELEPEEPRMHYSYAQCLFQLGRLDEAGEQFEWYRKANPDEADTYKMLGLIAAQQNNPQDAINSYKIALERYGKLPQHRRDKARVHITLSDVYVQLDRLDDAKAELLLATHLDPDLYLAYLRLARVQIQMGETEPAKKSHADYQAALARTRARGERTEAQSSDNGDNPQPE